MKVLQLKFALILHFLNVVSGSTDPFVINEAVQYDHNSGGVAFYPPTAGVTKSCMGNLNPGNYLAYNSLNFSRDVIAVQMNVAADIKANENPQVNLRLESRHAAPFATYTVEPTGGWNNWITTTLFLDAHKKPKRVQSLYITVDDPKLTRDVVNIAWFQFIPLDKFTKNKLPVVSCPSPPKIIPLPPNFRPPPPPPNFRPPPPNVHPPPPNFRPPPTIFRPSLSRIGRSSLP